MAAKAKQREEAEMRLSKEAESKNKMSEHFDKKSGSMDANSKHQDTASHSSRVEQLRKVDLTGDTAASNKKETDIHSMPGEGSITHEANNGATSSHREVNHRKDHSGGAVDDDLESETCTVEGKQVHAEDDNRNHHEQSSNHDSKSGINEIEQHHDLHPLKGDPYVQSSAHDEL